MTKAQFLKALRAFAEFCDRPAYYVCKVYGNDVRKVVFNKNGFKILLVEDKPEYSDLGLEIGDFNLPTMTPSMFRATFEVYKNFDYDLGIV
jgi:hypothetical protein